jgi:uncharacterized protein YqeY
MNERIQELMYQAGVREDLVDNLKDEVEVLTYIARPQDIQKFAELIVQECVDQIIEKGTDPIDWMPSQVGIRPEYVEMAQQIKRHFKIDS